MLDKYSNHHLMYLEASLKSVKEFSELLKVNYPGTREEVINEYQTIRFGGRRQSGKTTATALILNKEPNSVLIVRTGDYKNYIVGLIEKHVDQSIDPSVKTRIFTRSEFVKKFKDVDEVPYEIFMTDDIPEKRNRIFYQQFKEIALKSKVDPILVICQ